MAHSSLPSLSDRAPPGEKGICFQAMNEFGATSNGPDKSAGSHLATCSAPGIGQLALAQLFSALCCEQRNLGNCSAQNYPAEGSAGLLNGICACELEGRIRTAMSSYEAS